MESLYIGVKLDDYSHGKIIDNHNSGYLEMAVRLYVQPHLRHYHILIKKKYCQKLMGQLKSTPLLPIYA